MNSTVIRTGFSFRQAAGQIDEVVSRLKEVGATVAPITDRNSAFGWRRWRDECAKQGLRPVYGVELGVSPEPTASKPVGSEWVFLAKSSVAPVNRLLGKATAQFRFQPWLSYKQALGATDTVAIAGHRTDFDLVAAHLADPGNFYVALSPACSPGFIRRARERGYRFVAAGCNLYPRAEDATLQQCVCAMNAASQTYAQHILTREEWLAEMRSKGATPDELEAALALSGEVLEGCRAELPKGEMLRPERPGTLREMCEAGARKLGCDLSDPVYAARLTEELGVIEGKGFEDYFYILADLQSYARSVMTCGPARGSSAGSLVCYLLGITTVDPIPHGLLFSRFLDATRTDWPDCDLDYNHFKRDLLFAYAARRYGADHVARLGAVAMYKADNTAKAVAGALGLAPWALDGVKAAKTKHAAGSEESKHALREALHETDAGKLIMRQHPEVAIAERMENHPSHMGQHAAGIILTQRPVADYVAVDARTGATHCDKYDAEKLDLLKVDALGLTQLGIFEDALRDAGLPHDHLDSLSFDDPAVFAVFNARRFSGIFQFTGGALQGLARQVNFKGFDDIVALTSLARPGPMGSGGAAKWVARNAGKEAVAYHHPAFEPILKDTLGVLTYQEQVMRMAREVGGMEWGDVNALRKAMGKSQGASAFAKYENQFKAGAAHKGIPPEVVGRAWSEMVESGGYAFNRCLAGDTVVRTVGASPNMTRSATIAEMYNFYVEKADRRVRRNMRNGKGPTLYSWDGVKGIQHRVRAIHKNGVKPVNRYTFSDGSKVVCTPDHRFVVNGGWLPAGAARIGDAFLALAYDPAPLDPKFAVPTDSDKGKPARGKKYGAPAKGFGEGVQNPAYSNGRASIFKAFKLARSGSPCELCGCAAGRMEAHHTDFDSGRADPHGLQWLCVPCHKLVHYDRGRVKKGDKGRVPYAKTLVSVEPAGEQMTYDIEMEAPHHNFMLDNELVTHNSHAVAYAMISYWCAWLKHYHPGHFAAATLQHQSDADKQIVALRELAMEGMEYVPVSAKHSTDRWRMAFVDGKEKLIGPVQNVTGIGPKMVAAIVGARARGEPIPERAAKLLHNPVTKLDSLFPIRDAFFRLLPDPAAANILTPRTPVSECVNDLEEKTVVAFVRVERLEVIDENEPSRVERRGRRIEGPHTTALNLHLADDTGTIFAKVSHRDYERIGKAVLARGGAGKALYAVKGTVRGDEEFRMAWVQQMRYVGSM